MPAPPFLLLYHTFLTYEGLNQWFLKIQGTGTSLDGMSYTVTDRGGAIKVRGDVYQFDLLMSSKAECNNWGRKNGTAIIGASAAQPAAKTTNAQPDQSTAVLKKVLSYVDAQVGKAYSQANRFGANSFDCSSLIYRAFQAAGIKLVHKDTGGAVTTSNAEVYAQGFTLLYPDSYGQIGKNLPSPSGLLSTLGVKPGDIVFYNTMSTTRANKITHVAIVNEQGGITHAANSKRGVVRDGLTAHKGKICAVLRYGTGYSPDAQKPENTGNTTAAKQEKKDITQSVLMNTAGTAAAYRDMSILQVSTDISAKAELLIVCGDSVQAPILKDKIQWETQRKGSPGKLTFTCIKAPGLSFQEGDAVRFRYDGKDVFFGYVFTKQRDKEHHIKVTAYDQLRYFKNKDTIIYYNKTASELLKMLAADNRLQLGTVEDTGWKIEKRNESDATLFDILQTALDITLRSKQKIYVLYDDFGKICLRDMETMTLDILINGENTENFDYTTSIDKDTFNRVKLYHDNSETGKREIYIAQSGADMNQWGVLQYCESVSNEGVDMKSKTDTLLKLYNRKTRNLTVKKILGDIRARAGMRVAVDLGLGDINLKSYLIIEKAVHTFESGRHTMDLTLVGGERGEFIG
jgi:cell wall-associated NlpC family hydrolase